MSLLVGYAALTHLAYMLDQHQPSHHVVTRHACECVKALVDKPLVPSPSFIILSFHQSHRSDDVQLEDIESVLVALHLGE
jgi:hypothetical protein